MKTFLIIVAAVVAAVSADSCYKAVDGACSQTSTKSILDEGLAPCNASYGAIKSLSRDLYHYANNHIVKSFEYLLMSTHYGNYQRNREGFEKLFRKLSDEKWEESIEIIQHLTKRGGEMRFVAPEIPNGIETTKDGQYELPEIQSIAKALDTEKQLAAQAFHIHLKASERHLEGHDPEIANYIEKEFVHEQAERIRKLSGYVTDLKSMLSGPDRDLSLFLFDEYLQKQ